MGPRPHALLVFPKIPGQKSFRLPLSLLALGAALEGKYDYRIIDGNVDRGPAETVLRSLRERPFGLVGVTVMPGPQVRPAIEVSKTIRGAFPATPIVWGGYFPTLYPQAALNAPYVDYLVRAQGEDTLLALLDHLRNAGAPGSPLDSASDSGGLSHIDGLSWKDQGEIQHNRDRRFRGPDEYPALPYERVGNVRAYLQPSFLGTRTAVHQAAIGCRFRCEFCGVVSMFNGVTREPSPSRFFDALSTLRDSYGANAIQFYDHNFFNTEESAIPLLEVLARVQMPWWCYARTDALATFSTKTWELIRRSRLTMTFMGADSVSDDGLRRLKKGARVEHTLEAARRCKRYGVIPEFSFILGGPADPEGETERTFEFIRRLKRVNPRAEIILYFYSPTPQREPLTPETKESGLRLPVLRQYGPSGPELPATPEEWTQPQWVNYVCHEDAPWLTERMRCKVNDFATVLGCRFPTEQDYETPRWRKAVLRGLARWRFRTRRYGNPWELRAAQRWIPLRKPQRESL